MNRPLGSPAKTAVRFQSYCQHETPFHHWYICGYYPASPPERRMSFLLLRHNLPALRKLTRHWLAEEHIVRGCLCFQEIAEGQKPEHSPRWQPEQKVF